MGDDKVKKLAEEALNRLSAELEAGKSETLKNYLAAMGRFHRYSWGNVLLINSQSPHATHVAGFHTWHDLGRWVKKDEKGIVIFAPVLVKQGAASAREEARNAEEVFRLAGFRTAHVFDVSQTEGRPLPEFAKTTGNPNEYAEKLKALVAKRGIEIEHDASIAPAQGASSGGRIRLMPGMAPAEEFSVLAHELAHEILHHGKEAPPLPRVVRETQAEAIAFVVCRGVGLETNRAAADYLALYNGDKKTLAESLTVIQETSAKILNELLPEHRIAVGHERTSERSATDESAQAPTHDSVVWDR
jgi:hypothetical protein